MDKNINFFNCRSDSKVVSMWRYFYISLNGIFHYFLGECVVDLLKNQNEKKCRETLPRPRSTIVTFFLPFIEKIP